MSGRNPPSYCTLTLIAMQGHQQKGRHVIVHVNSLNKKDPPTALTVLAVNVPLLLLYRKDDLLNISLPER